MVVVSPGPEDIEAAAQLVGFPAVIKPIAAAASMGVVRVDSLAELQAKVAATQKQLESLYLDEHVSQLGFWEGGIRCLCGVEGGAGFVCADSLCAVCSGVESRFIDCLKALAH